MKKFIGDFMIRGMVAAGFGPIVLAILYLILNKYAELESLSVGQICTGIFSMTALAFMAGGINAIYKLEKLPLMAAILIHGGVLYIFYLITYLLNDWLKSNVINILVFTVIFAAGYLIIWGVIYCIIRKKTNRINELLKQKQQNMQIS